MRRTGITLGMLSTGRLRAKRKTAAPQRSSLGLGASDTGGIVVNANLRHWLMALTLALVAVATLAGCSGGDPAPDAVGPAANEPETAESRTEQRSAAAATANDEQAEPSAGDDPQAPAEEASEPSAGDAPQAADADGSTEWALTLDRSTSWQDVFETLTAAEQACIRDRFGDEAAALLAREVLRDETTQTWETDLFACLAPETGRDLLLGSVLAGMKEEGMEAGAAETACLREVLAGVDPATVVAATEDDGPGGNAFLGDIWRCLPELLFESVAAEIGVDIDAVSEPERACMREWVRELDAVALLDAMDAGDDAPLVELTFGLFRCSPALLLAGFGGGGPELDPEAEACLRQLLDEAEASDLFDEDSPEYVRFYAGLLVCLPALSQFTDATGAASAGSDGPDDHADFFDGATVIAVGVQASGELGSDLDSDYFVFAAEQGVLYEIDIGLVTLGDSVLTLYDAEWLQLAFSDDYADTFASRIYWLADYSGDHYIEVWGYDLGAYTLIVEAR